jgi:hypothetical protein
LTIVALGDGCHTSFWLDSWIGNKPLSTQFPALFSHVQHTNVTVAESFSENGWQLRFHHITSHRAERELDELFNLIGGITLNEGPGIRSMRFGPHKNFSVKAWYFAMNYGGVTVLGNTKIWNSLAQKNVKYLLGWPFIIELILEKYLIEKELFLNLSALLDVKLMKILPISYLVALTLP